MGVSKEVWAYEAPAPFDEGACRVTVADDWAMCNEKQGPEGGRLSPKCLVLMVLVEFGAQYLCGLEQGIRQNSCSGVVAGSSAGCRNTAKRREKRFRWVLVEGVAG